MFCFLAFLIILFGNVGASREGIPALGSNRQSTSSQIATRQEQAHQLRYPPAIICLRTAYLRGSRTRKQRHVPLEKSLTIQQRQPPQGKGSNFDQQSSTEEAASHILAIFRLSQDLDPVQTSEIGIQCHSNQAARSQPFIWETTRVTYVLRSLEDPVKLVIANNYGEDDKLMRNTFYQQQSDRFSAPKRKLSCHIVHFP